MTAPNSKDDTGGAFGVAQLAPSIAMASIRYSRFLARVTPHRHGHRRELMQMTTTGAGQVIRALAMRQAY